MKTIIFWGHGSWKEKDGRTSVPQGSPLYFFARHKEEINTERMNSILYTVTTSLDREVDWQKNDYFGDMTKGGDLRRIKPGGAQVRNYRLFPPSGGVCQPDEVPSEIQAACKIVTTAEKEGETLEALIKTHGEPNAKYLWVPCRAVEGKEGTLVDGGNYKREEDYFKA